MFGGEVLVTGYTPEQPEDEGMVKVQFDISMSKELMRGMMKIEKGNDGHGVTLYVSNSIVEMVQTEPQLNLLY